MQSKADISNLALFALNIAEKLTAKFSEIYFSLSDYLNIDIEENSIKNNEIGSDIGVGIRVINQKGSLGFAYTNRLERKYIEKTVKTAISMMRTATEDPDFKDLPPKYEVYNTINGLYDRDIKYLSIEDSILYVEDLIKICDKDDMAISQSGNFSSSYNKTFIFNSNGLSINSKTTISSISSHVIVKDKVTNDTSFGFESQIERNLNDINGKKVVKTALKNAKRNLNRKKIKSMKAPLILTPKGVISFILRPLASAINAETFQYKRSFLVDKRGEYLGPEILNIEDNALIDGAVGSATFDGEGVPCKNKRVIDKGKFLKSGLLHNSYTAGKEGVESSGNAARDSYSSLPTIGITNLILQSGKPSKDDIIRNVKEGIILDYTGDRPNISTGDFSGLILQGNLIQNGEILDALNETMFGINLLDLFRNIEEISKETKIYGPFRAPFVKIADVRIIGGAS
ncbi:MAG: TldD/PmbA family protein [Candidatus Hermodarchaeota archaeon]